MPATKLQINRYLCRVRGLLPCAHKEKKKILAGLKENIHTFMTEDPEASMDDLLAQFGTPHDIVATYVDEMDQHQLIRKLHIKGKILSIILATVAFVLILFTLTMTLITIDDWATENGYGETEIIYEQ